MPDPSEEEVWYVIVNDETRGPLSQRDIQVLANTNELTATTYIWKVGMKQWRMMSEIDELSANSLNANRNATTQQNGDTLPGAKVQITLDKVTIGEAEKQEPEKEDAEAETIENKDENPLQILENTVANLVKKSFFKSEDGMWNLYDETRSSWIKQEQEPLDNIEKLKTELFNKLKAQLFFDHRHHNSHKRPEKKPKAEVAPPENLTPQQLLKREKNKKKTIKAALKKKQKWYNAKINTFVYISGLPYDITEEELKVFASRAGVMRVQLSTGKEKIKIYKDEAGMPKGDAAVSYLRQESVAIAIQNLNGQQIRNGFTVNVQKATFSQKKEQYTPRESKKQTKTHIIQAKIDRQKKLGWDETVDEKGDGLKIIVMKYVFDASQGSLDDAVLEEIKEDIEAEVTKIGPVQRIRYYELHPDGVVEVKFKNQKDAQQCITIMNGRSFDDRILSCEYWDGVTDYKRDAEALHRQEEQLNRFASELEAEGQNGSKRVKEGETVDSSRINIAYNLE